MVEEYGLDPHMTNEKRVLHLFGRGMQQKRVINGVTCRIEIL